MEAKGTLQMFTSQSIEPLQFEQAITLAPAFVEESPQGRALAQLSVGEVAQVLVLLDRVGRIPDLQQRMSAIRDSPGLLALAEEAGAPISQGAADGMTAAVECLDDDQLAQVTGGSMALAVAGIGLAAAVATLGGGFFYWLASRNDLETAKINAGNVTT
ncbi:MAG: hypothetical protein VKM98_03495 [Cyanobacteriota bacterium]|nr:hypothetical protein [Cyanobacteriota bacterium]